MSHAYPPIVITGVGIVSPLGVGYEAFSHGLALGEHVIRGGELTEICQPVKSYSSMPDFDPKQYISPRKSIKLMCREVQLGVAAASLAVEHAKLDTTVDDQDRRGVVLGSEMLYGDPGELADVYRHSIHDGEFFISQFGDRMTTDLFPLWMLKYLPNMPACHMGISVAACGPCNSVVQGDASSLLAIIEAVTIIQRGWADVMIAGGTGSTIQPVRNVNFSDELFSRDVCRPFDAERDGMSGGEGCGAFVLESLTHARQRGAQPLAEIAGFGRTFGLAKKYHYQRENGASTLAIRNSIARALRDANCAASEIDHVNAHGLGTRPADPREAAAIQLELGDVPVTAPKSFFGNLGAGSGTIEMACSVLAFETGDVPPTLNYTTADADCPVNVIAGQAKPLEKPAALVLSQSSTGQAAAIVLRGGP